MFYAYLHNLEYKKIIHFTRAHFFKYVSMDVKRVSKKKIFSVSSGEMSRCRTLILLLMWVSIYE